MYRGNTVPTQVTPNSSGHTDSSGPVIPAQEAPKAHCARSGEKAAVGGDYWIAPDEWVGGGCRIEKRAMLCGFDVWVASYDAVY